MATPTTYGGSTGGVLAVPSPYFQILIILLFEDRPGSPDVGGTHVAAPTAEQVAVTSPRGNHEAT